ncbi:hypothetical protein PSHT_03958 [Puccinia striiformis]|uniref:Uncharacterized protein n=1 Tax=Puccinia striiformis TaxID=27350 RepID=A0A2S4WE33_9BASI|nr:hypothetical protein PSHT_03958 [Puccinia striiformis]
MEQQKNATSISLRLIPGMNLEIMHADTHPAICPMARHHINFYNLLSPTWACLINHRGSAQIRQMPRTQTAWIANLGGPDHILAWTMAFVNMAESVTGTVYICPNDGANKDQMIGCTDCRKN